MYEKTRHCEESASISNPIALAVFILGFAVIGFSVGVVLGAGMEEVNPFILRVVLCGFIGGIIGIPAYLLAILIECKRSKDG